MPLRGIRRGLTKPYKAVIKKKLDLLRKER